ncbi:MAG: DNA polymerase I [Eubacteriales bacterium]
MQNRIVIIDGNSLINRAYYAIKNPMITKEGLYTHAVYGFINILNKIRKDYEPEYMTVAFDRKAPTFRHIEFETYKAGRKTMPIELAMQLPLLKEVLDAMNIKTYEIDGFEADDIIGSLTKFSESNGLLPLVITGDKDELQLVSDLTSVLITKKGISEFDYFTPEKVFEKYGFGPEKIIDFKGLMGDPSDNIPGVPGIGEKTAQKLIIEYGTIENLIDKINESPNEKLRDKIIEHSQIAIMSKRLATIHMEVPLEFTMEDLELVPANQDKLIELYKKLEFNSLLKKFELPSSDEKKVWIARDGISENQEKTNAIPQENVNNPTEIIEPNFIIEGFIDSESYKKFNILKIEEFKIFTDYLLEKEKTDYASKEKIAVIKVFGDNNHVQEPIVYSISIMLSGCYFFIDNIEDLLVIKAVNLLNELGYKYLGHNLKTDYYQLICSIKNYDSLYNSDKCLFRTCFDTAIAQYVLEPDRSNYGINSMFLEYFHESIKDEDQFYKDNSQIDLLNYGLNEYIEYGEKWCKAVFSLFLVLFADVNKNNLDEILYEIELPLIEVLASMEFQGFKIDRNELLSARSELSSRLMILTSEIYNLAGEEFNINSTKQLAPILFEKLNLAKGKKTKTGFSTNFEVLEKLKDEHEIIPLILEYRNLSKLNSTYVEGLLPLVGFGNKIHAHFQQTVAATGRISCTEPNLQNIPVKLEIGRKLRKAFIPDSGDFVLIGADYNQIELRILAHLSQDETLIQAFREGDDIHKITASKVFNIPFDEVTQAQRNNAKAVNFGVIYGMSGFGLSSELNIPVKEAEKYINEYFKKYSNVKIYLDKLVSDCKINGYVTTIKNRKRIIHEINASNYMVRQMGERLAMNSPLQGSAADIIKIAMINVYKELNSNGLKSKMNLQVHDELIIVAHNDEIEIIKNILTESMMNAVELLVPLDISIDVGKNWYELK